MTERLDHRLNAYRPDLADVRLSGKVQAERFVEGHGGWVNAPVADLHREPDAASGMDTQLLYGDKVTLFDRDSDWAWVQSVRDGYVGYVRSDLVRNGDRPATHRVIVPRTILYQQPDMKTPRTCAVSMGTGVTKVGEDTVRGTRYALLMNGMAAIHDHLLPVETESTNYVAFAEQLIHTPYLWGGASAFGIDCSGLVQLSMRMVGKDVLRDTDMQVETIGTLLSNEETLRRGDLVFWKGHVGIMTDAETLIHANGHTMTVAQEPLDDAIERIGYLYGQPVCRRRP